MTGPGRDDPDRVVWFNVDDPDSPVRPEGQPADEPRRSPKRQLDTNTGIRSARYREIVARGPIPLALVDGPLPEGVRAIVRLGQGAPLDAYVLASAAGFEDETYDLARLAALEYQLGQTEEVRAEVTLYADGRAEALSADGRREQLQSTESAPRRARPEGPSALLAAALAAPPERVPGVGMVRVVRPPE